MLMKRIIPCLLLKKLGLVKTVKFKNPKYVGDPINAVKIFNEKEVDELIILDITATVENTRPQFELLSRITKEAFIPFAYGGGVRSLGDLEKLFSLGVEKVSINSYSVENPEFIKRASDYVGSQSIIVSIDVKKNLFGKYEVYTHGGKRPANLEPVKFAMQMEKMGAGEILINSINRDGTMVGYDIELIKSVANAVSVPVIACGGAGRIEDFSKVVTECNVSAMAAGSIFVFHGKHRAVLINYPTQEELEEVMGPRYTYPEATISTQGETR